MSFKTLEKSVCYIKAIEKILLVTTYEVNNKKSYSHNHTMFNKLESYVSYISFNGYM